MSHNLSKLKIHNFKSIKNETFEFADYTPMVGYNNAGKSNILQSVKWVLRKYALNTLDFNDHTQPVVIEADIDGISERILEAIEPAHRASIEPYIVEEKLKIRRTQLNPAQTAAQVLLHVLRPSDDQWVLNPTGIDNAIKNLFPEPIHIGAMENSEDDVTKSTTSSTIGKLLSEIIGPIENQYGENVRVALNGLKDILDADGSQRAAELTEFDTQVNSKLNAFFPDINIKVHIPTPELKEVFKKGTIKVIENNLGASTDVGSLGHGAQRSIQMALIRHLADLKVSEEDSTTKTLLLIDEPELYLHPQAIEILRQALVNLSNEGYQIIFSTHSPFMITQKDVQNTLLIRKNIERGTYRKVTLKEAIPEVESQAPHQMSLLFSLSNSSNILFSEKVILAEGKTENKLLPRIIEKLTSKSVALHKCAFVQQGGSGDTKKSMSVLTMMGIPSKALVDFDYIFKEGVNQGFLESEDLDLQTCKAELEHLASEHGFLLGEDGWPKKSPEFTAAQAFAILAQQASISSNIEQLCNKLKRHHVWVWRKGTIENHLNLTAKNEAVWASFANRLNTEEIETILPNDYLYVSECIDWLVE